MKLVANKQLDVWRASRHADGKITVDEAGNHLGRKGMKIGGGLGLVVGLLSPPLLASVVIGGAAGDLVGRSAKHKVESGPGEKMRAALPSGFGRHPAAVLGRDPLSRPGKSR